MTIATPTGIQQLQLAYFGRPSDPAALTAWPTSGLSIEAIVLQFVRSAEYQRNTVDPNSTANAGGSRTFNDTNLINSFYLRLFGRLAVGSEVAGWSSALASGAVNYDYLGLTILNAGLNLPTTGAAGEMRAVLVAKVQSNDVYTGILYNNPVSAAAYSTAAAIQDGIAYSSVTTTSTPQTLVQAQAAVATMVTSSGAGGGQAFTLTTAIETINPSGTANSTITGVINGGAPNDTFQTGDIINGNATSNAAITVAATNGVAPLVTINTLQGITFRTLAAQAINAQLFNNVGTVGITGSQAVLTVNNGALASTYASAASISGVADGLTVNLRAGDITGTSNTINFSVAGTGSSVAGTATRTALASGSTGVEGIAVATSGSNFFSVAGNTTAATDSATLTFTGAGVNDVQVLAGGLATTSNINGSALTGALTLDVTTNLSTNDTISGGTATSDTLRATTSGVVATGLSVTGFETLRLDSGAAASTLVFAATPVVTTLRVDAGTGNVLKTLNTLGTFTTLAYRGTGTAATAANANAFNRVTTTGGFAGTADSLAVAFSNSGVTNTNANAYSVQGAINVAGVETFNVSVADATANNISRIDSLLSNTLQTAAFTGNNSFTSVAGGAVVLDTATANSNSIATVNFSGVTATGVSQVQLGNNSANVLAASTQITAGVGGLTANVATVEAATDSINFTGGAGNDRLTLTGGNYAGIVTANLGAGTNQLDTGNAAALVSITANNAATTVNNINILTAGVVSYVATGALTTSNISAANGAAATINGTGSTQALLITGSGNADTITSGSGNDTIFGGIGADRLTGSTGSDTFAYNNIAANSVGANADTIVDFVQGAAGDVLQISLTTPGGGTAFAGLGVGQTNVFVNVAGAANLATNILVDTAANIGAANIANTRLAYDTTNNRWLFDADGNWTAGSLIFANSTNALTAAGLVAANVQIIA